MNKSHLPAAGLAADRFSAPVPTDRIASQPDGRLPRARPLMRKYEVAHLSPSHDIEEFTRVAPAAPLFEDAFAAIGRGAIVQTEMGPVAIEDLLPGDMVKTTSNGFQRLRWRGTMTIVPGAQNKRPEMGTMTRITADAMGLGRPGPDLVLGQICVNGIEIETLHPGLPHTVQLRQDMQLLFMSLFPHKTKMADFANLLHPRINLRDLDLFAVA